MDLRRAPRRLGMREPVANQLLGAGRAHLKAERPPR
jgi:hypothetical protein